MNPAWIGLALVLLACWDIREGCTRFSLWIELGCAFVSPVKSILGGSGFASDCNLLRLDFVLPLLLQAALAHGPER